MAPIRLKEIQNAPKQTINNVLQSIFLKSFYIVYYLLFIIHVFLLLFIFYYLLFIIIYYLLL